jgi:cytochrome c biogenesis protein CcdA
MLSRFTVAGILIVIVSGSALVFSAIRYLTAKDSADLFVGVQGFSYALLMLFYAFGLLIIGVFGARFLSKLQKRQSIVSL